MAAIGFGYNNRSIKVVSNYTDDRYSGTTKLTKVKRNLTMVEDVAFLPDNHFIVCDWTKSKVRIYDEKGKFLKLLANDIRPKGIATTPRGMVAVIDYKKQKNEKCVKVFSSDNGDLFSKWGDDFVWKPRGVTFSNKGRLIVTDISKKSHSVGVYTLDGRRLQSFGSLGCLKEQFNNPCYVDVDIFDRIIVSDRDNHSIKIFDERGKSLGMIGGYGSGEGQLRFPRGVCSDSRGNIIVCDSGNKRVCLFSSDGRYIQNVLSSRESIGHPFGIGLHKDSGKLVLSQHHTARQAGHLRKVRVYEFDKLPPLELVKVTY